MSLRIAARSWSARSDSAMFSGTLHVSHITSSSMSLNDARGCAASAVAGASASQRQQRDHERAHQLACARSMAPREEVLRDLAARHRHHVAGLVEDEGLGQLRRAVLRREVEPVVAQARVGELVLAHEVARRVGVVLVGDAEHRAAAAGQPPLRALEHRRLVLARPAPRRPEVQHHDLAAQLRQRAPRLAVQRGQRHRRAGRRRPLARS